jgi:hypothetical protein
MKKIKYLPPQLIDLSLKNSQGACGDGSGDLSGCNTGNNAFDCSTNGSGASSACGPGASAGLGCSGGSGN